MKAISTKFLPATNTRGARIKAYDLDNNHVTIPYPHEANRGEETGRIAALALCAKMNWPGKLAAGAVKGGYVFVFIDE